VIEEDLCTDRIFSVETTDSDKLNVSSDVTPNIHTETGLALSMMMVVVLFAIFVTCFVVARFVINVKPQKKFRRTSEVPERYEICVGRTEKPLC
jgi:hypothetical protein